MNPPGELFDPSSVKQDSPRLAWMKKHGLQTMEDKYWSDDVDWEPWACFSPTETGENDFNEDSVGTGKTEHDSIVDWTVKHGVKLWNEEGAK